MTTAEKKEYLKSYIITKHLVESLRSRVIDWADRAENLQTAICCGTSGRSNNTAMQQCIEEMIECQNKLVKALRLEMRLIDEVEQAISSLDNPKMRLLMIRRYIEGAPWDVISEQLGYDLEGKGAYKLHDRALEKMTFPSSNVAVKEELKSIKKPKA
ncbi:MAG: hypothetical protein IKV41_00620 [Oscillospiraceae bacterium]|nr:hypothetical protein [Oscillospiraceae bacterium]